MYGERRIYEYDLKVLGVRVYSSLRSYILSDDCLKPSTERKKRKEGPRCFCEELRHG